VRLAHQVDGRRQSTQVALVGAAPSGPRCDLPGEVEGVDVHHDRLMLSVNRMVGRTTRVYTYGSAAV